MIYIAINNEFKYYNRYSNSKLYKNREFRLTLMLTVYNPVTLEIYSKNYYYQYITNKRIVINKL